MNNKGYIIYAGDNLGKQGTVMNTHAINLSKVFVELGYEVVFVSQIGWHPGMPVETHDNGFHCFYSENHAIANDLLRKIYRKWHFITGINQWKTMKRVIKYYKPDLIVYYGYVGVSRLAQYSRKNNIPFVIEHTDWFEKKHYKDFYGRYIYCSITKKCITRWSLKASGVIAVSSFFSEFYSKYNIPTIQIPPLFDNNRFSIQMVNKNSADLFRLVYAGTPWNKDVLLPVIKAVSEINKREKNSIRFDIVGIDGFSEPDGGIIEYEGVVFHGRTSREKALEIVSHADCSILLRRKELYAIAGFSTKFSESMWVGVPVICTMIGGTDSCIIDGVNGFLVPDNSTEVIMHKLEEIIEIPQEELMRIKREAYNYAHQYFDYHYYVDAMREFIDQISVCY